MAYSQNDEEKHVLAFCKKFEERHGHTGNILSIGENDGKHLSNVLAAIERGWMAMLVEPAPTAFEKLLELHDKNLGVYCYQVAISDKSGIADFYDSDSHLKTGDTSLLSTLNKGELVRWQNTQKFETIKVPTQSFDDFMFDAAFKTLDLISIDAEGCDMMILKQINLFKTSTAMVIVEWNGKDLEEFDEYMLRYYFRLQHKNAENLIYSSFHKNYVC